MNILRIVYDWPAPWTGLSPGPYYLTLSQAKLGHKIIVLTGNLNGKRLLKLNLVEKPAHNVVVINLPRAIAKHTGPFLTTAPLSLFVYLILRLFKRIDVIHGHGHTTLFISIYKKLFKFMDKTCYVVHMHNCSKKRRLRAEENHEKFTFLQKYFDNPLHELAEQLALQEADKIIAVSEDIKSELEELYKINNKKIVTIENGIPTDIFHPHIKNNKKNTFNLLSVGVLSPRKNIGTLILALKYLNNKFNLTLIGTTTDINYKNKINNSIKENKLQKRINIIEYVDNLKVANYYKNADLFVLPSKYEGLPKVVLESLACATPVLTTKLSLQNKISGLFFINDFLPEKLANQIETLSQKHLKVDTHLIHRIYSWDNKVKDIDKIYKEVGCF